MIETKNKTKKASLADLIVEGMQEKKAQSITVIDLRKLKEAVADYFIICSANSDTQADSIHDSIDEIVFANQKLHPWRTEGDKHKEWIIVDYGDVVAHIFRKDKRPFYNLEELWGDGIITKIENLD
ncbi:MAG: ribosome silencing factor [Cytophaga sp.]|uniref:ribosome silencing factor n=1 Tax=Cytophaga sp. TaxID=29535 RepID=UPI003F7DAD63